VIGLQALSAALAFGALAAPPVLFRLPGLAPLVQQVYHAADFCTVRDLPWAFETPDVAFPPAAEFAGRIDIREFAFDPGFRGVAMIDFFLRKLGVAPESVPPALRRNAWLAPRLRPVPPDGVAPGYVLVCPKTSMALRDMPEEIHAAIIGWLTATGHRVVTQGAAEPGADAAPACATLAALAGWVASAAAIVSADTAMPHLADAYDVPCLAFFTTHRPDWRVRDYTRCRAVHLPAAGVPEALEFSRGPDDLAAARQAWFPHGADLSWLHRALAESFG
jgi:hypothetical protein